MDRVLTVEYPDGDLFQWVIPAIDLDRHAVDIHLDGGRIVGNTSHQDAVILDFWQVS